MTIRSDKIGMATILSLSYWLRVHAQWYRGGTEQSAYEMCFLDLDDQQLNLCDIFWRGMERQMESQRVCGSDVLTDVHLLLRDSNVGLD